MQVATQSPGMRSNKDKAKIFTTKQTENETEKKNLSSSFSRQFNFFLNLSRTHTEGANHTRAFLN